MSDEHLDRETPLLPEPPPDQDNFQKFSFAHKTNGREDKRQVEELRRLIKHLGERDLDFLVDEIAREKILRKVQNIHPIIKFDKD